MARTPEGAVKAYVKRRMHEEFGSALATLWPVLNGMGAPAVDCHACLYGHSLLIETKRDDGDLFIDWETQYKKGTPRQQNTLKKFSDAGSLCFVIDSPSSCEAMIEELKSIGWTSR